MALDPRTPVLVGAGSITQRIDHPTDGTDAVGLMVEAARLAALDAGPGGDRILSRVGQITVPQGTWFLADPGRLLAGELGLDGPRSVLAEIGVLQQDVLADACTSIASGDLDVVLVAGGEAKHRALQATIAGVDLPERVEAEGAAPNRTWAATTLGVHDVEILRHAVDPSTAYALVERARGHRLGRTGPDHARAVGDLWHRFAMVAATRPDAWDRSAPTAAAILDPAGAGNRAIADPYTKLLCSQWNVDMGVALLLCSAEAADAAGIARDRWVFPHSSAVANHSVPVVERADLTASPGADLAAAGALSAAGVGIDDLAHLDLYSCFPAAVQTYADALGLDPDDAARPLTATGGMTFFGGPLNSYVLHALAVLVGELRAAPSDLALSSSVSGFLTKQGFGVWGARPPAAPFTALDLTAASAAASPARAVDADHAGPATVVSSTVVHGRGGDRRTVVIADTPAGARTIATTTDAATADAFATDPSIGAVVSVSGPDLLGA